MAVDLFLSIDQEKYKAEWTIYNNRELCKMYGVSLSTICRWNSLLSQKREPYTKGHHLVKGRVGRPRQSEEEREAARLKKNLRNRIARAKKIAKAEGRAFTQADEQWAIDSARVKRPVKKSLPKLVKKKEPKPEVKKIRQSRKAQPKTETVKKVEKIYQTKVIDPKDIHYHKINRNTWMLASKKDTLQEMERKSELVRNSINKFRSHLQKSA